MEILELKLKNKLNSNNFIATTDCGVFLLHSDVILQQGISKGEIEDELFFSAVSDSAYIIALEMASTYLANSVKTEKQVKDYLYKKSFKTEIVSEVIAKLKEYKVLDDAQFAELYVRSNSNFSKTKLRHKLCGFGIKQDVVARSLSDVDDYESCYICAKKFLKNKVIDNRNKIKLTRRLQSQGFSWEDIKRVLNEYSWQEDEQEF